MRTPQTGLVELVELIVQIPEEILFLARAQFFPGLVAARLKLLLEPVERTDPTVLADIDARIVAPRAVRRVDALTRLAITGQGCVCIRGCHEENQADGLIASHFRLLGNSRLNSFLG